MIRPTDEMRDVFLATQLFELGRGASEAHAVRRALTAVLALVEQQHIVLCGSHGPDGVRCERLPGHGERHGYVGVGELVLW